MANYLNGVTSVNVQLLVALDNKFEQEIVLHPNMGEINVMGNLRKSELVQKRLRLRLSLFRVQKFCFQCEQVIVSNVHTSPLWTVI